MGSVTQDDETSEVRGTSMQGRCKSVVGYDMGMGSMPRAGRNRETYRTDRKNAELFFQAYFLNSPNSFLQLELFPHLP